MADSMDSYIQNIIKLGDEGSGLLRAITAPTLKNCEYVRILNGGAGELAVLDIPEDYAAVVHSASGCSELKNAGSHASSLVDCLVQQAELLGAKPLGFANVVDSSTGEKKVIEEIAHALRDSADKHGIAVMNGENAILGSRVNCDANVSGTMVSIVRRGVVLPFTEFSYASFNPKRKPVFLNSDGVGTKTEFYERAEKYHLALEDSLAMKLDDAIKFAGSVEVAFDIVETKGNINFKAVQDYAGMLSRQLGIAYLVQEEKVDERIRGYREDASAFNVSGSAVSTIDEEKFMLMLPSVGQSLVAIAGLPNPRSNGITDKRKGMIKLFGENWHETEDGKIFLEYLTSPSVILYPVFKKLVDEGLTSSVYHMSGGAFNGKLAKPLAKHKLFVKLEDLFAPDWREQKLAEVCCDSAESAYSKWPMGNDGFVATSNPDEAVALIEGCGLSASKVGVLEKSGEKSGVELTAFNGNMIYFDGK